MRNFRAYWNLHKKCWSIQHRSAAGWRLYRHANVLIADQVEFVVNEGGRQRVIKEQRKNVHAFALFSTFTLANGEGWNTDPMDTPVRYNPYQASTFVDADNVPVYGAYAAFLTLDGKVLVEDPYYTKGTIAA
jgi:hypothetical protein